MKNKFIYRIIILIIIGVIFSFLVSFLTAKKAAMDYLEILTIVDQESYEKAKKKIYRISSDEVRDTVFETDYYKGSKLNPIVYKIDKVKCIEIKGFNHFIFSITFTIKDWNTVESLSYVKNGRVYDTHRRD